MSPAPDKPALADRPNSEDRKILGIELLRILSSLAVLVFHYQHFIFVGAAPVDLEHFRQPFYPYLSLFYEHGFYGVEIFWCISGFIFFWKYSRTLSQGHLKGRAFFVLRLSRLYPLHFATLLFMAAMQAVYFSRTGAYFVYQYNDLYHFSLQLFMGSNWGFQLGDSFNGPIWSISIEVLVYAIFYFSLRFASRSAVFIGCVALAAAMIQVLQVSVHPVFSCVMFFYIGCLTAIVYEKAGRAKRLNQWVTACSVLAIVALLALTHFFDIKAKYFLVVFAPALIYLCVTHIPSSGAVAKVLVPAGNMTYASYLLHVPIQIVAVIVCSYAGLKIPFYSPFFFLGFIAFTLLASHWTYEYFEMPAQKMMRGLLLYPRPVAAKQS